MYTRHSDFSGRFVAAGSTQLSSPSGNSTTGRNARSVASARHHGLPKGFSGFCSGAKLSPCLFHSTSEEVPAGLCQVGNIPPGQLPSRHYDPCALPLAVQTLRRASLPGWPQCRFPAQATSSDCNRVEGSVLPSSTFQTADEKPNLFQHDFVRFQAFG